LWTGFYVDSSLFYVDSMLIVIHHAELACTENSVSIVRLHCVLSLPVVDFLQALVQAFRASNDGPVAPLCSCDGWNTPRRGGVRHRHTVFVNVHCLYLHIYTYVSYIVIVKFMTNCRHVYTYIYIYMYIVCMYLIFWSMHNINT
jgi:hypothetical protein